MRRETADYSPASEALPRDRADEPDAAFVFATRAVVVDAWDGAAWILELSKTGAPLDDDWHDRALAVLRDAPAARRVAEKSKIARGAPSAERASARAPNVFVFHRDRLCRSRLRNQTGRVSGFG